MALIPRSQGLGGVGVNQVFQTGESKNLLNGPQPPCSPLPILPPATSTSTYLTFHLCLVTAETPMLEGEEEEGLRLWHLVKSSEDPEIPKHRKSSMRERERAKAIPEIYLTRLLSMKVTHTCSGLSH